MGAAARANFDCEIKMDDDAQRYHCGYCGCDITLRLKCTICSDFDLCLHCFSAGAVIGSHKSDHPYQLIDEGSFPLLTEDWGAIEEVLLLDAVEQDGFGNWEDIGAHVVTKTARESKDHYSEIYIEGVIGQGLIKPDHHSRSLDGVGGEVPLSLDAGSPIKMEPAEQQELGYMPLRDDFDREYNNDAEKIISGIDIYNDDEDIEKELKLAHIDVYTRCLLERDKRKSIAKQHNLIGGKQKLSAVKRKHSREERELRTKYRSLARLMDNEGYEKLITSLKKEKNLKQRITNLIKYRQNGITRMEDCVEFDLLSHEQDRLHDRKDNEVESRVESGSTNRQDLVLSPGLTMLSPVERKLCTSISLKPYEYLNIKSEILKVSAMRHIGVASKPSFPKELSHEVKKQLFKHFTKSGWIN